MVFNVTLTPVTPVLAQFANTTAEARRQCRQFIGSGLATNTSTDFDGGDLIRSYGGWENLIQARKAHEGTRGVTIIVSLTSWIAASDAQCHDGFIDYTIILTPSSLLLDTPYPYRDVKCKA